MLFHAMHGAMFASTLKASVSSGKAWSLGPASHFPQACIGQKLCSSDSCTAVRMASRLSLLARTAVGAAKSALPQRGGAGAPIKLAARPDKPLPLWYELWWDNGVFPGQPACDFMWGPLPANLSEAFYAKCWTGFVCVMGLPLAYLYATVDEFSQPMVPHQFPPEVRDVIVKQGNTSVIWDYSQPQYEEFKARRARYWTPM